MGINIDYEVIKHGFYPDIMGEVKLNIGTISEEIKPINLTKKGKLLAVHLHVTKLEG